MINPQTGRTFWTDACLDPLAAINFMLDVIDDDWDRYLFLKDWREGTVEDWPEFLTYVDVKVAA